MLRQLDQGQACPWLDKQWWRENETKAEIFGRLQYLSDERNERI